MGLARIASQLRLICMLSLRMSSALRAVAFGRRWPSLGRPQSSDQALTHAQNPLLNYFNAHDSGRGIWKWTHYFEIYHRHFRKFVGKEVHILEIGVYSGGSLQMWRDYFGPDCHVYGVDIEESCKTYENDWTQIFIGDQEDRSFWKRLKQEVPVIDIIIDDGGHKPEQQIVTLEEMLPHLNVGGVYLCEDIGGYHNEFNSYASSLIGHLNALDMSVKSLVMGGFDKKTELGSNANAFQAEIHSMHFYPFVMVVEKTISINQRFVAPKRGTQWQPFYD